MTLATLAVLVATEPFLAIVWDEGFTLGREARVRAWFRALLDPAGFAASWSPPLIELVQQEGEPPPGSEPIRRPERGQLRARADLFRPEVIAWFWPFAREEPHGHPPFYAVVGLVGDVLTPWRADLSRARLGPMLVFSLVAGWLYRFSARRSGSWVAALAVGAFVLQPRLFGHAHYAAYDALLTSLWVAAVLAFAKAVEVRGERESASFRWPWAVGFGLICGAAAATKFTGWFLPLPFLVWTAIYRDRKGLWTLLAGGLIALATLYVLIPPWWNDPIEGVRRFLASNLGRAESIPIVTMFLGRMYETPEESLPWYNTMAWTVFVTPVGFLAFALAGVVRGLRRFKSEPFGILILGHWAFLLILRALPNVPGHDGVRLFLPAFGCLAIVASLGAGWALEGLGRWAKGLIGLALLEGAISVAVLMPVPLAYYSPAVGGPRGAASAGMEPTYYWDALTSDVLGWLNQNTPRGEKVAFHSFTTSFLYLRQTRQLIPEIHMVPNDPTPVAWYVVQHRPGGMSDLDRALVESGEPAYVYQKLGVPLIWVFPNDQVVGYRIAEQRQKAGQQQ